MPSIALMTVAWRPRIVVTVSNLVLRASALPPRLAISWPMSAWWLASRPSRSAIRSAWPAIWISAAASTSPVSGLLMLAPPSRRRPPLRLFRPMGTGRRCPGRRLPGRRGRVRGEWTAAASRRAAVLVMALRSGGRRPRGWRGRARLRVFPGHPEPGDDGGVAAPDDQCPAGWQLPDHVGRDDEVAAGPFFAVFAHRGGAAEHGRGLQGVGVADGGEPGLRAAGVHDDAGAAGSPPAAELGFAVGDGGDLDAFAAGVGQPGRHRDRADLGDLVEGEQERGVEAAAGHAAAGQGGGVVDFAGRAGE